jgi:beta-N-acetylhexosaminidase
MSKGAAFAAALTLAALGIAGGQAETPTVSQMVGQLLVVRMHGEAPSASFLRRVRTGQIGGVVLFSDNVGPNGPSALIARLQAEARAGHQPPLLVAIDQEGGVVKRLPGAPTLRPREMKEPATAEAQGEATARNLKSVGVNVDLAPVLDVGRGGFITPRAFGLTPRTVAARGAAFAAGLARGGILATAKHFPGLGYALITTDKSATTITASVAQLNADWVPFTAAIDKGVPLVMLSTAVYPALGSKLPAAVSKTVVADLRRLGFDGAIVTDALDSPAVHAFMTTSEAAVRAIAAGVDLVLTAGGGATAAATDGPSIAAFDALVAAARTGKLSRATLQAAYDRVLALKHDLGY